jgi:hypothetical protein
VVNKLATAKKTPYAMTHAVVAKGQRAEDTPITDLVLYCTCVQVIDRMEVAGAYEDAFKAYNMAKQNGMTHTSWVN